MNHLTTIIERNTNRVGTFNGMGSGFLKGRLRVKEHGTGVWFYPFPNEVVVPMAAKSVRQKRRRLAGLMEYLTGAK